MRRIYVLIIAGVVLALLEVGWLAAAHFGERETSSGLRNIAAAPEEVPPQAKVDINQAGLEELVKLPGITQSLAERIIQHRPYRKLDDLVARKVLGKKQFAKIREYVVVHPRNP